MIFLIGFDSLLTVKIIDVLLNVRLFVCFVYCDLTILLYLEEKYLQAQALMFCAR
jgi:hypothetical protein